MNPEFATNKGPWFAPTETVAAALNDLLANALEKRKPPFDVWIASAYFNPDGYALIADWLEQVASVRLLLGAEPVGRPRAVEKLGSNPERRDRDRLRRALSDHEKAVTDDRDLLGFTLESDATAKRLVEWVRSGRVEVRRFEAGFLHGKCFLIPSDQAVLAGSSNFTANGLARNRELNLVNYMPHTLERVREWYEELWDEAVPYDLAARYDARFEPHLPYHIYLRMLLERYGIETPTEGKQADLVLTGFQLDGVDRARRILAQRNGVLIADGVGLGKTFLAGALIEETVRDKRQHVLVVAPATLRDGPWRKFAERMLFNFHVVSYEQLAAALGPGATGVGLPMLPEQFAMVVVDEAHALRNPDTDRAMALRRLLGGTPPKQLVLLTATPVNNSLWDLYYLLSTFLRDDSTFAADGVPSIRERFKQAVNTDPEDLTPDALFDVLDQVAVRRTRRFVKKYYPHEQIRIDDRAVPLIFPKVAPPIEVAYTLDAAYGDLVHRFAHAINCEPDDCDHEGTLAEEPLLTLGRYQPSRYRLSDDGHAAREAQLTGLLRSNLLKRFESSAVAFAGTCERMANSCDAFVRLLDAGHLARSEAIDELLKSDTEDLDDFIEVHAGALDPTDGFDVDTLRGAAVADAAVLRTFAEEARRVTPEHDPKLAALATELRTILAQAEHDGVGEEATRNNRKVLIFSYFADTVKWIREYLDSHLTDDLAPYADRVTAATGDDDSSASAVYGFAPQSAEAPPGKDEDRFDILIATDVLAEGVNLQQARHVINYDLPWNPMRLVQRHGRIDRIGSPHTDVYIRCFMPDAELDELLRLEERLQGKIAQAARSIGVEQAPLPGAQTGEVTFNERRREDIEGLRHGSTDLFEDERVGGITSGEELRQELRRAFQDPSLKALVEGLAWGSGAARASNDGSRGYVFCARVGDHPTVQIRYVDLTGDEPAVMDDALTCLRQAQAEPSDPSAMTDSVHRGAYDAWGRAREHIFERWDELTDPAKLHPDVPKALREAADLLRVTAVPGVDQGSKELAIDTLNAALGERYVRPIREILRSALADTDRVRAVMEKINELGLTKPAIPEALPQITHDDIHLICWLAVLPSP